MRASEAGLGIAGTKWKVAFCPGCRARRMMPRQNTLCLFCVDGLERARPARKRGDAASETRRPYVPVPALRPLREARGLTVSGLARRSGVDYTTVMRLESQSMAANPQKAQHRTAERLAHAIGVAVEDLAGCRGRRVA